MLPRGLVPTSGLALVVCLEVLLHIIRASKLLLAARVRARHGLLGSVNFGVPRGVARSREGLVTPMGGPEPARVPFRPLLQDRPARIGVLFVPVGVRRASANSNMREHAPYMLWVTWVVGIEGAMFVR